MWQVMKFGCPTRDFETLNKAKRYARDCGEHAQIINMDIPKVYRLVSFVVNHRGQVVRTIRY